MKYDFTSLMNRSGHDSIAVDQIPILPHPDVGGRHELPVSSDHSGSNARESQRTAFWLL